MSNQYKQEYIQMYMVVVVYERIKNHMIVHMYKVYVQVEVQSCTKSRNMFVKIKDC